VVIVAGLAPERKGANSEAENELRAPEEIC